MDTPCDKKSRSGAYAFSSKENTAVASVATVAQCLTFAFDVINFIQTAIVLTT